VFITEQILYIIRKYEKSFFTIIFILFSILSVIYLAHFHVVYANTDFIYHFERLLSLKHSIMTNQFPLVSQGANVPYGITMSFYPWLTLYPFALLTLFIHNGVTLFYTIIAIISLLTYLVSYFSYLQFDNSIQRAFLFAVLYTNSSIIFNWNFLFGNISSTLSMAFIPLTLFGFINLMHHKKTTIMLTMGLTLTLSTHVINGLIFAGLIILLWLINIYRFKWQESLKLVGGICFTAVITSIFWYPAFKLFQANAIVMPARFHPMFAGILQYVGSSNNYLYGIPEIIGLLSILNYRNDNFKIFHWEIWSIGFLCLLLNINVVAVHLSHIFPLFSQLQFAYRLGLVAHIFFTLLATHFITGRLNDNVTRLRTPIIIIFAYAIFLPLSNELSYQFLMQSRPTVHSINDLNRIALIDVHRNKPFQYLSDKKTYQALKHYNYSYDYAPNVTVRNEAAFDQKLITSIYNRDGQFIHPVHFTVSQQGIRINNHGYANIQYPIVIYHGVRYQFLLNGKSLKSSFINWKLTWQSYRLTLKHLPAGNNLITIKSAKIK
jgi:hypothetical protein